MQATVDIYSPAERRMLDEFFGDPGQKRLPSIDTSPIKAFMSGEYRPWGYASLDDEEDATPTNVAQVVLAPLQQRLPNAAVFRGKKNMRMTRKRLRKRGARVTPLPVHLFTINWALTGPGLSWPEAYHVAPVIGYGRQLVTVSADSRDAYGIEDFPIGSFAEDVAVAAGCHAIITAWWRALKKNHSQERFAIVEWEGLFNYATVHAWEVEVWGKDPEEEE